MPIIQQKQLNQDISTALWQINESLDDLVALYEFSPEDWQILNRTKIESRKMEWLAARLAVKSLMRKAGIENRHIYKDPFGKPHVHHPTAQISISHTEGYGAAVLHLAGPVGIDIELPRPQIQRIAPKFLHPSEKDWAANDMEKLTQVWSAKEALYKLHGRTQLIFAEQLIIQAPTDFYPEKASILENSQAERYALSYEQMDNLIISVAY